MSTGTSSYLLSGSTNIQQDTHVFEQIHLLTSESLQVRSSQYLVIAITAVRVTIPISHSGNADFQASMYPLVVCLGRSYESCPRLSSIFSLWIWSISYNVSDVKV